MDRVTSDRKKLGLAVRQALGHLDDLLYLRWSPLVVLLGFEEAIEGAGEALQRALFDAIEAMRPTASVERDTPAWRRWRCLSLRYLQAEPAERILQELGVSARQMRRDNLEAIEELASILWTRSRERQTAREKALASPAHRQPVIPDGFGSVNAPIDAEVLRMGASPRHEPVDLTESLESALALVARLADKHGTNFTLLVPKQAGPVSVNRGVLRQVLVALLSYAAAVIPGSRIEIRVDGSPQLLRLSLRCGWDTDHLSPATVVDSSRLTIYQQLIRMQGGAIEWRTENTGGFAIDLHLPAAELTTVLVIDDNPELSDLFARYLRSYGYQVTHAGDGERAVHLARASSPDIIALDLMIPDQDGWEILQQLQSHPETRDIPVIVCSALREEDLALSLGAADFLAKPVTQQALVTALDRFRARRAGYPGSPSGSPSARPPESRPAG